MQAEKEGWLYIEQIGRGGKKRLYEVNALPEPVRLRVMKYYMQTGDGRQGVGNDKTPQAGDRSPQTGKDGSLSCPASGLPSPVCDLLTAAPQGETLVPPHQGNTSILASQPRVPSLPGESANQRAVGSSDNNLLPEWAERKARAKADLVHAYNETRETAGRRRETGESEILRSAQDDNKKQDDSKKNTAETVMDFLEAYNSGIALPGIFQTLGQVARSTLERWRKCLDDSDNDYMALAPRWGKHRAGESKITEEESRILFAQVIHQNKIKIGTAINLAKFILAQKNIPSPSCPATMRRAVEAFQAKHFDLWTFYREGQKALIDKVLPYIERDDSLIEVGDVLVADGHRCNAFIHNPFTGKPCRPMLIGFYDWKSRILCGVAVALEENVQVISAALRKAILRLGKTPKILLIDNGKAFKSKIFTGDIDLEQSGLFGMFSRLDIKAVFAWPYNARSKPIERFFQDFGNQFERYLPSYCGSGITDKPASLMRNEKMMRSFYGEHVMTIDQFTGALAKWWQYHAFGQHPTLKGQTKGEVFEKGRGPGVDESKLRYLMMDAKVARIGRNGVAFMKADYFHEALYGLRDSVVVRYDRDNSRTWSPWRRATTPNCVPWVWP